GVERGEQTGVALAGARAGRRALDREHATGDDAVAAIAEQPSDALAAQTGRVEGIRDLRCARLSRHVPPPPRTPRSRRGSARCPGPGGEVRPSGPRRRPARRPSAPCAAGTRTAPPAGTRRTACAA